MNSNITESSLNKHLAITISHQYGSGGSIIGQKLSTELSSIYLDHELIKKAAEKLGVKEEHLLSRDEKAISNLEIVLRAYSFSDTSLLNLEGVEFDLLKDEDIFKAEADIIAKISNENPTVILGRCGSYILRKHPKHVSIYVHADINSRCARISEKYKLTESEALRLIQSKDKERLHYIQKFTREDLYNANMYDLAINTSRYEPQLAVDLILSYIKNRFK
jgi:cytidylate kinase